MGRSELVLERKCLACGKIPVNEWGQGITLPTSKVGQPVSVVKFFCEGYLNEIVKFKIFIKNYIGFKYYYL